MGYYKQVLIPKPYSNYNKKYKNGNRLSLNNCMILSITLSSELENISCPQYLIHLTSYTPFELYLVLDEVRNTNQGISLTLLVLDQCFPFVGSFEALEIMASLTCNMISPILEDWPSKLSANALATWIFLSWNFIRNSNEQVFLSEGWKSSISSTNFGPGVLS